MNKLALSVIVMLGLTFATSPATAQDSVDVTFRYNISNFPSGLSVPGEFNAWNNAAWPMVYQGGTLWTRTSRLRLGGNPLPTVPGAYQYKFYYTGANPWPNDPLNHKVNAADHGNSYLYIKDPTIYHFLPNQRTGTVTTNYPAISAYMFPKVGSVVDTASIRLTLNGTLYSGLGSSYNFATKHFSFTPPTSLANGNHTAILRAGSNADTVTFIVQVGGPVTAPMPAYAKHGVTLPTGISNDSTTFRLLVSFSNYVVVRIAPAGQPVASADPIFMRKDPATDNWWINVALPAGTYEYQYQTDAGTLINDPWGRHTGTFGSRFTVGPEGLTADNYVWRSNSYVRPPMNKIVVYELHVGEFGGGYYGLSGGQAGFAHLTSLIPYFDSLGINAIELMPINDFGLVGKSGHSWGYDLNSYHALEPGYGTPRDFKVLVDSAHARGIAIILDVVFNHLNDTSPLWQMQPDVTKNPYFKNCSDLRFNEDQLCFFRDMDHWTPETQELVYNSLKMWIDEYRVDGFRYDFTQGIGWNINEPTKGILGWANRIHQEYNGAIYQIAEHLPESPALVFHSGINAGWHDSFRDEIFDEARFRNRTLTQIENLVLDLGAYPGNDWPSTPSSYASRNEPVNGTVNHDEQSLIYEMTQFQSVPLAEAILRDKLYASFIFTSLGIPMLWEGMELSAPRGWTNDNQKLSYRPVEFSLRQTVRGQEHYQYYKSLIRQRRYNPALYDGVMLKLYRYDSQKTLVWGFQDVSSGSRFMAVANLSSSQQTLNSVPWLGPGNWYDIFDQSILVSPGSTLSSLTVPAYTAKLYSNRPDSLLTSVEPIALEIPVEFGLEQNFPNPFNPSTTIKINLPSDGTIDLKIYDVLGREVRTMAQKSLRAGSYEVTWSGDNSLGHSVGSGVYFYRILFERNDTGERSVAMKKMILAK